MRTTRRQRIRPWAPVTVTDNIIEIRGNDGRRTLIPLAAINVVSDALDGTRTIDVHLAGGDLVQLAFPDPTHRQPTAVAWRTTRDLITAALRRYHRQRTVRPLRPLGATDGLTADEVAS